MEELRVSDPREVNTDSIHAAQRLISDIVRETPVWPVEVGADADQRALLLKCEQMQITGSFKIRGALNFVRRRLGECAEKGLITASAGNHAQGVAFAGRANGIPVDVVMPQNAALAKIEANLRLGANVVLHGDSLAEARTRAEALAEETGRVIVPPFRR